MSIVDMITKDIEHVPVATFIFRVSENEVAKYSLDTRPSYERNRMTPPLVNRTLHCVDCMRQDKYYK